MVRVSTTTREWTCGKSVTKGGMPTTTGSRECCGRCGPGLPNDAPHPRHGTIPPAMLRAGPSKQRTAPDASGTRMPSARRSRPRRRVDSRPAGRPCRARPCGWARAACFTWNTFGPSTAPVGLAPRARRVPKRSPRRVAIWPSVAAIQPRSPRGRSDGPAPVSTDDWRRRVRAIQRGSAPRIAPCTNGTTPACWQRGAPRRQPGGGGRGRTARD